ncbi:MAG: GNAT family acetyltransferase [Proteobacteria bacterium]|nr:GNAT family acetyltransferase [Pseudomonadota bacterium]
MFKVRPFQNRDEEAVVQLWKDCELIQTTNDPHKDIRLKLAVQPDLFLVGTLNGRVIATVMAGYEGHRGWLNYLAVSATCRQRGFGRKIVAVAEKQLRLLGCPKINIQVRVGNEQIMEFYRKIGFQVDDVVSLGKRLNLQ